MKRFKNLAVTIAMLLVCAVQAYAYDFEAGGLYYNISNAYNFEVEVTSNWDNRYSGAVVIPSSVEYNGKEYQVTSIGHGAFYHNYELTSVVIPNGIREISNQVFENCENLTSITIPASVYYISENTISWCSSLMSIQVDEDNMYYDSRNGCNAIIETSSNRLIAGCNNSYIPDGVTSIEYCAFAGCDELSSVTLPSSVTNIGSNAFTDCSALSSLVMSSNVTSIGDYAFSRCHNLKTIIFSQNLVSVGTGAFEETAWYDNQPDGLIYMYGLLYGYKGEKTEVTSVEIVEGTKSVPAYIFDGCTNLASITIPNSVESVGRYAFRNCSNLTSIVLPSSVRSIGQNAFQNCCNLATIVLPDSLIDIGYSAFENCNKISSILIPKKVQSIAYNAFYGCSALASISVSADNTVYDSRGGCNAIIRTGDNTLVLGCSATVIPNTVESIGSRAFDMCADLASISIPESVKSIESTSFYNCSALTSISVSGDNTVYDSRGGCNAIIRTNDNALVLGCSYTVIPNTVTSIDANAFRGCCNLLSMNIPESVTKIGDYAFYNCSGLTSVNIPENIVSMGYQAFYGCNSLTTFLIPQGTTEIKDYAFQNCSNLTSLLIPEGVTRIGRSAFSGCAGLTSINIPSSVTSIGYGAFSGCTGLTSIEIPSSVTSIGGSVFTDCRGEIIIHCNIPSIDGGNLNSCMLWDSKFEKVIIGDEVTSIGDDAFAWSDSLRTIIIGEGVKTIGSSAFLNCAALSSIVIPTNVTSIGASAFSQCYNLQSIIIGGGVTSIGNYAFNHCNALKEVIFEDGVAPLLLGYNYYNDYYSSSGRGLFYACPLETLYLGRNLIYDTGQSYGYSPFYDKNNLFTVTVGANVTSIAQDMFSSCENLSIVNVEDIASWCNIDFGGSNSNPLFYSKNLYLNGEPVEDLFLPEAISEIKSYAFNGCVLNSITIPESVQSIGHAAFSEGVKVVMLKSTIPPTLTSSTLISDKGLFIVPDNALSAYQTAKYWSELVEKIVPAGMAKREVTLDAKSNTSALHMALGDTALPYVVDLTVNGTINSYDFMVMLNKMNRLRYLDLTNAHIVYNGYEHYTGYHSENNKLPAYAFYQKDLLLVKLPQDITSIGDRAFSNCSDLSSISIPKSVTSVGAHAFYGCSTLANVTLEGKAAIGTYAFSGCSKLSSIRIAEGVSSIGSYAFSNCSSLRNIIIPEISASIGSNAFNACSGLESFTVLKGTTSVGDKAFLNCKNLKSVSLDGVSSIGSMAFGNSSNPNYSCNSLRTITILKGLTSIGDYAFGLCGGLREVNLPEGNISIGSNAFFECDGLMEINIPHGVTSIGSNAFTGCSYLVSIKLPTTLQTINSSAFSGCSRLAEVHIPSSVRNIHESAFSGCTNMKKVYVYTIEPTAISQNTFAMNSNNNFVGTLYAPKVSYYVYWYDTQWSQFEDIKPFDESYDNFYLKGDLELNDSTGVVQGNEGEKPDAELGSNSGLVTDGSIDQELGDVEIEHNGTNGGSIIAGGNSSVEVDNLTFRITVTGGRWYFFCFPFDVRREDIRCENGADWVFRYYDGEERAQNGRGGWKNVTSDGNGNHLKAATGYIFQCSKSDVLILSAKNQKIKQEKKYNELVEHVTQNMQDASWNFVGNPYLSYYDITGEEYSAPITIWNGSSYVAIRPGDDDYVLSPFEAFFVQKPEGVNDIEYDPEQQMTYYQMRMAAEMKAARRRTHTINPDRLLVNLTLSDTATTDRTRVVFNNEVSLDYEMDCDAAKFTANGVPQLYTIGNRAVKYAINERPVAEGVVTVGYTAPVQGNYTLAAPRMDVPVCLKDNRTGIIHDFSEGSYTFMTEAGTFEDRFTLMMKSDATSIDKSQLIIDEEAPLYNTKGQWVDEPQGQGVYIKDNRKVVKL